MTSSTHSRTLPFSVTFNFRDVGGYRGLDGRTVRWRRLFRSDSLHRLGEADREAFAALGVRTVIDLRRPREIEAMGRIPAGHVADYQHIHPEHAEWDATTLDERQDVARWLADRYVELARDGMPAIGRALRVIADERAAPVVVHCFAGKDRTGVLAALTLTLLGVPRADIMADYATSEAAQAPIAAVIRRELTGEPVPRPPDHFLACPPEAMGLFLTELAARYGSIHGYARTAGVNELHVEALRAHLLHR